MKKINLELLKKQKLDLLRVIEVMPPSSKVPDSEQLINSINGVIVLIDCLQDHCVDDLGMLDSEVFYFEGEE